MNTNAIRKRRKRLWEADPRCYWCGIVTVLIEKSGGSHLPNEATIDHLRPRHHPGRLEPIEHQEIRRVLSCFKCNNERDTRERAELPKEWFYERGCGKPVSTKSLEELRAVEAKLAAITPRNERDRRRVAESIAAIREAIKAKLPA
jgi:hypothetical protein